MGSSLVTGVDRNLNNLQDVISNPELDTLFSSKDPILNYFRTHDESSVYGQIMAKHFRDDFHLEDFEELHGERFRNRELVLVGSNPAMTAMLNFFCRSNPDDYHLSYGEQLY